ncbi:MAG TPA: phosphoribosylanthranilate isomerase [Vicinamibacterales bacterium]|nr:phosphoribosylanthranilate isomerase [Vicinamibacterales bacterium]
MTPRIKVCGITRAEDASEAVRLGAAALGFVFWPKSPRVLSVRAARDIAAGVPLLVARIGVFVDAPADEVARIADEVGLDGVQLHGDERVDRYERVKSRLIKAVSLETDEDVARAATLPAHVTTLVDAADRVRRGGTGRVADWSQAAALASRRPVILAGGLTPENVGEAVRAVRPWALDVSSGVETAPGIKSRERLEAFFAAVAATAGVERL